MEQSGTDSTNYLNYMVSGSVDSPAAAAAAAAAATVAAAAAASNDSSSYKRDELNLPYAFCEVVVAVCAVIGNALVIIVFSKDRKLRRRTNYYIISLATADLLVGLFAIPFAILASIGLPTNLYACLFTVSVLVVLCTISIFCLVAVSIDRYWAILHPMGYSRNVRTKTAIGIICVCWIAGTLVGFLPLFGWNAGKKSDEKCIFVEVMDYDYLVFLYFATIIFPALLIAAFYAHIYRVVVKQLRQIVEMNPGRRGDNPTTGTMLRLLGAAQKRDVKATQNLSRIVAFFIICWFPLYTINCVKAFCPDCEVNEVILNSCIILSHLNSVGNPLLYAYHLKDFRAALQSFICKLLFPNAEPVAVKNRQLSVISENRGSQRSKPRENFAAVANVAKTKTPRTSLLRRATDNAAVIGAARASTNPRKSLGSSPEVELRSKLSDKNDDDILFGQIPSPESSELDQNAHSPRGNDSTSLNLSPISGTSSRLNSSEIEMKTCKSFVDFVPETINHDPHPDDNKNETICIIKADVNRSPDLEITLTCHNLQFADEETRKELNDLRH